MLRVEKVRYNDGMKNAVLDIQVSTAAELPSLNDVVCGLKIIAGSIAQVIQTGAWYTLDDNGTWYDTSGAPASSASSLNASLSMSPTLDKAIADSKDDMIDLTEDDIDRISDELEQAETPVKEQKKEYVESIEEPEKDKDGEDDDELL
jgi:hypothetical protein